jgi:hypothetical protein
MQRTSLKNKNIKYKIKRIDNYIQVIISGKDYVNFNKLPRTVRQNKIKSMARKLNCKFDGDSVSPQKKELILFFICKQKSSKKSSRKSSKKSSRKPRKSSRKSSRKLSRKSSKKSSRKPRKSSRKPRKSSRKLRKSKK